MNSTVTFINLGSNGGNDLGLFWNAGTAINIGDNNTILGNYLAGTAISFTGSTATLGNGGARALSLAGVSFAGPATINALGGPGGGDWDGGLMYNGLGQLVPIPPVVVVIPPVVIPPVVIPPVVVPPVVVPPVVVPPAIVYTGNVLLSSTGAFTPGPSGVTLTPGTNYPTSVLTIDGVSVFEQNFPGGFTAGELFERTLDLGAWSSLPADLELELALSGSGIGAIGGADSAAFALGVVFSNTPSPVPAPAAAWLLGSGLATLGAIRRRRRAT